MKRLFNDDITQSIAATVQDVLEGKPAVKKEAEEFKPHMMYDPNTGKGYKAEKPEDHERMAKLGYVHEKPKKVNEVEEPNKPSGKLGQDSGERNFKKAHTIKKSGEKEDGTVVKEETLLEALNQKKLLKVAKDLEKSIKKTGDLAREITKHEELEMSGEAYGEIGKGQEMMDYGIRYLESDLKDYFKKNESVNESTIAEAYNKSKELARIKKIDKLAQQIGKEIKSFPDEITDEETDDKDLAQAYYDMNKGLGDLEYGIGDYEYALKNLDESVNESTITLDEAKIDVDYIGDKDLTKKLEKKFKIKIKNTGNTTADVSGTNANLIKFLKSDAYLMDEDEIEELFPELMESVEEESEKQAAYKKVFNMALKKFGVKGIGELDAEKKKEFFNFVDKNYEAKAEELDKKGDKEVDELTDKQKKLPAGLQKAIKAKEKEEVKEGKLSVNAFVGSEGGGPSYKKFGLRLKKLGSSQYGGDDVELSGPDAKLMKFAVAALGVEKPKNLKDAQDQIDDQGP